MSKQTILLCSLLPAYFGRRSEDANLLALARQYASEEEGRYRLRILLGSAHDSALEHARTLLRGHDIQVECVHLPFVEDSAFDEIRGHEISSGKQLLTRRAMTVEHDIYFYVDSDISIGWGDVKTLADGLTSDRQFVNVPYVIHKALRAPAPQLGAYLHRRTLFRLCDYSGVIYPTHVRNGKLRRIGAPDCNVRNFLLGHGVRETRAAQPRFRIRTRHYSNDGTFGLYDAGRISRHYDGAQSLGFDPVKDEAAMEPQGCEFVVNACRRVGASSALDLGTGQGNACRSLVAAGVAEVVSLDHEAHWTRLLRRLRVRPAGAGCVEFRTVGLIQEGEQSTYDLTTLGGRHFDVVVIDGPHEDGSGRLAAALGVRASHYLFHDAIRDRQTVLEFVATLRGKGVDVDVEWFDQGRGMARVSVAAASP